MQNVCNGAETLKSSHRVKLGIGNVYLESEHTFSFGLTSERKTKMESPDINALITQLQQQQSLFTQALKAELEGHWTGENSVEAFLYALDPNMVGTLNLNVPVTEEDSPKG